MGEVNVLAEAPEQGGVDAASFLRRVPLLHALQPAELLKLASLVTPQTFDAEAVIVRQGEPGDALYIVAAGQVRVVSDVPDERLLLSRLGPGEFFGEMSLLTGDPRNAAVVADTPSVLLVLAREAFQQLVSERAEMLAAVNAVAERRRDHPGVRSQNEAYSLFALSSAHDEVTMGSAADNEVVLTAAGVAPHHAVLERKGDQFVIRALHGETVYLNRQPVTVTPIQDGDIVTIGSRRLFVLDGVLKLFEQSRGVRVEARNLRRVTQSKQVILNDVSLEIFPGELVAVVGASGAGKTTLMHALMGFYPVTSGEIIYDGVPLAGNMESFRRILAFVPQHDIVHSELTVRDSLNFSGRLRLPGITAEDLDTRVDELVATLRLSHRADTLVGQLSGGQRKRVCVAAELLSEPGIIFLDEPTSGLDPGLDQQLMFQLRALADEGRTVVLTTHATRNLRICDRVVVMHGGYLAYTGTPAEALTHFAVEDFTEVYGRLEAQTGAEAAAAFQASSLAVPFTPGEGPAVAVPRRARVSPFLQFGQLVRRDVKVLLRDRVNMALRLVGAPLLALLQVTTFEANVLDIERVTGGNAQLGLTLLYLSCAICLFLSAFTSANVITREASIFQRERLVGVSTIAYLASKLVVLSFFALVQGSLFVALIALKVDFPGPNPETIIQLMAALVLVSLAGMTMGLFISAMSPNPDRAAILVVLALIPQLIFAGATVPRSEMSPTSKAISEVTVTKWALELTGGLVDLDFRFDTQSVVILGVGDGAIVELEVPERPFENAFTEPLRWRWAALAGFSLVFTAGTYIALRWRRPSG